MRATDPRTSGAISFLVAVGLALLLAGCSAVISREHTPHQVSNRPATGRAAAALQHPLDLMPSPAPRESEQTRPSTAAEPGAGSQVSPDGNWVAYESTRDGVHGVWIARRDGEGARRISGARFATRPSWSPDGSRLVFLARPQKRGEEWSVWVADVPGGSARKLSSVGPTGTDGVSWFPDSRHLCYGSDEWLIIVDTSAAATRAFRLPNASSRVVGVPAVSPDGRLIVFAVAGEGAWMASMPDGGITQLVSERDVDAFAWAPGGRQIAFRTARDGQWKVHIIRNER